MNSNTLTEQFVSQAIATRTQFSIKFDDVWESFGYTRKNNTTKYITERSGLKRIDYDLLQLEQNGMSMSYAVDVNGKIYFNWNSWKFAIARANTQKGNDYLIHLIELESQAIAKLERQFTQPSVNPQHTPNETEFLDLLHDEYTPYPYTVEELWIDCGKCSVYDVKNFVKLYFTKDEDWIGKLNRRGNLTPTHITKDTYTILMMSFRSLKGADTSKLPQLIVVNRDKYYQHRHRNRKRKNEVVAHEQLCLEF